MSDEPQEAIQYEIPFATKFDDLFTTKIYAVAALGLLLAWAWTGLSEGYPAFMDGSVDSPSVLVLLLAFAASPLAFGYVRKLDVVLVRPAAWVAAGACACVACLLLLAVFCGLVPLGNEAGLALTRCTMVLVGASAGILVLCCATVFACLRPTSMVVGFSISCVVMFVAYFTLDMCKSVGNQMVEGSLSCLLPC